MLNALKWSLRLEVYSDAQSLGDLKLKRRNITYIMLWKP